MTAAPGGAPAITRDAVLGGRVRLLQPAGGYRVAIDPVLLAAAVDARPGSRILDLGSGTGAAALCLAVRLPQVTVTGVECDPGLVDLATRSARLTGVADRVRFVVGDVAAPLPEAPYDQVLANPPFLAAGAACAPRDAGRRQARIEGPARLAGWLDAMLAQVVRRGRVTLIHRADRLDAVLHLLHGRAGDVAVLPLWPRTGQAARRVLVAARSGCAPGLALLPGLSLHRRDGSYTAAATAVLRDAAALRLQPRVGVAM